MTEVLINAKVKVRVIVKAGDSEYTVGVKYDNDEIVDEVKKLVVAELKEIYDGFDTVKAGYLTLFNDKACTDAIMEDEMPVAKRFYGRLNIPQGDTLYLEQLDISQDIDSEPTSKR